jgi:Ni/Co efflux regulator RcnB
MFIRSLLAALVFTLTATTAAHAGDNNANAKAKTMPPGLQKNVEQGKPLPKGWRKKLAKGEVLDANVYARGKKVSPKDAATLPKTAAGESWIQVQNEMIRINESTRKIIDIITTEKTPKKK